MKKYRLVYCLSILCLSILLLGACSDSDDFSISEKRIIVDSKKELATNAISATEMLYLRIKYESAQSDYWKLVYHIKKFDYEEGYLYVLKVNEKEIKKPLEDQEKISYELIEVLSKTKVSESIE